MALPSLSRSDIQDHTSGGSFERGEQYVKDGAVRSLEQTDDHTLKAQVQGSDVHPYVVTIEFDDETVQKVSCTCPYYEGTWCKHIVAVVLKMQDEDAVPRSRPVEISELVGDLDRSALIGIIERLVEHDPRLLDEVKRERIRQDD